MHVQFSYKSSTWWYLVVLLIIMICMLAFRLSYVLYQNHNLWERFSANADESSYQRRIPMEEMDLSEYEHVFSKTIAPIRFELTHNIKTPVTLRYYNEIPANNSAYALEISEGTTITAISLDTQGLGIHEVGYGYTSYPTYTKGWRYVKPFMTEEAVRNSEQERFYYIRIESLEAVLGETISANQPLIAATRRQSWLDQKVSHTMARYIDHALHDKGIYLSSDLTYGLWSRINIVLLGLIGMMAAVLVFQAHSVNGMNVWWERKLPEKLWHN